MIIDKFKFMPVVGIGITNAKEFDKKVVELAGNEIKTIEEFKKEANR